MIAIPDRGGAVRARSYGAASSFLLVRTAARLTPLADCPARPFTHSPPLGRLVIAPRALVGSFPARPRPRDPVAPPHTQPRTASRREHPVMPKPAPLSD